MSIVTEISTEIKEISADKKGLRSFGIVVGTIFALIAVFVFWRKSFVLGTAVFTLGAIGSVLVLGGLLIPAALRPVHKVWMSIAIVLGAIMSRVILSLVFYLVVTPIGLLMRLFGKDPITKKPDPSLETYWIPKDPAESDKSRLMKYY